jgi:hypothetical protein
LEQYPTATRVPGTMKIRELAETEEERLRADHSAVLSHITAPLRRLKS